MSNSKLFCIFILFLFTTIFASSNLNIIHKCSTEESEALLLFKQNLSIINYTNEYLDDYSKEGWVDERCHWWLGSDYHPIKFNWTASTDCCNWNGITCDRYTGDVIGVDLSCGMLKAHDNIRMLCVSVVPVVWVVVIVTTETIMVTVIMGAYYNISYWMHNGVVAVDSEKSQNPELFLLAARNQRSSYFCQMLK